MRWPARVLEFFAKGGERFRILIVSVNVAEQAQELLQRSRIDSAVLLQAIVCPCLELIERPASFRYSNDRNIEMTSFYHRLQCRKYLFVSEVPGRTKEHQRVGMGIGHSDLLKRLLPCLRIFPGVRQI